MKIFFCRNDTVKISSHVDELSDITTDARIVTWYLHGDNWRSNALNAGNLNVTFHGASQYFLQWTFGKNFWLNFGRIFNIPGS